jgi:hypothetical protein
MIGALPHDVYLVQSSRWGGVRNFGRVKLAVVWDCAGGTVVVVVVVYLNK